MAELMCSPVVTTQTFNLVVRIETLIALSRVFSAGGENLDQTLEGLTNAYSQWLEENEGDLPENQETLNRLIKVQKEKEKKRLVYEFNRLFVGPQSPPAPPYESVYCHGERQVMQASTLDVRRWYRSEELSLTGRSNEPDDYIAIELEFAAYLLANAQERYQKNQPKEAEAYIENYNAFYRKHLAVWLPRFVKALSISTREPFFVVLGEIILKTVRPINQ